MKNYKHYIIKVTCFNCRKKMTIKIPVGVLVSDHHCPNCKTRELVPGYVTWK